MRYAPKKGPLRIHPSLRKQKKKGRRRLLELLSYAPTKGAYCSWLFPSPLRKRDPHTRDNSRSPLRIQGRANQLYEKKGRAVCAFLPSLGNIRRILLYPPSHRVGWPMRLRDKKGAYCSTLLRFPSLYADLFSYAPTKGAYCSWSFPSSPLRKRDPHTRKGNEEGECVLCAICVP